MSRRNVNSVRVSRNLSVMASWLVWFFAVVLALTTNVRHVLLVVLIVAGFIPYLVSIKWIEPWLERRRIGA